MKYILMSLFLFSSFIYSKTMIIEVLYDNGKLKILNEKIIEKDYPSTKASFKSEDNFYINIKSDKNEMLEKITINNPLKLHIPLPQTEDDKKYTKPIMKKKEVFILRFSFNEKAKKVEISSKNLKNQTLYLGGK